jgi:ferritin
MMMPEIEQAFNRQVNAETYSAFLYLSMSTFLESKGLRGMASWMRIQFDEEMVHAMKFIDFINERGGRALLGAMEAPPTEWDSPRAVYEAALEHESKVTGLINDLVDLAIKEKDHAAATFLQWFVNEQVEEESTVHDILDKFALGGDHPGFLYMLDAELGQRAPVAADEGITP